MGMKKSIDELLEEALVPEEEQPYEVPDNWVWVKLSALYDEIKEKVLPEGNEFYIGLEHLNKGGGINSIGKAIELKSNKTVFKSGDVLYGRLRPYLNKHAYVEFYGISSTDILVYRSKIGGNDSGRLLDNYFGLPFVLNYANQNSNGINLPRISSKKMNNLPFPLCPRDEQKRIANKIEHFFTKLDGAKQLIEEVKKSFELRWEAILSNALQGKLTKKWRMENPAVENAEHLYERIQDLYKNRKNVEEGDMYGTGYGIPKSWKWVRLGNIVQINPPRKKLTDLADELECTFIPMPAVSDETGQITKPEVRPFSKVKKGYTFFLEGDILFAKITPCMENGKTAIAQDLKNGFGFGSTEFHVIRPNQYVNTKLLYYLLRSKQFRMQAKIEMTGAVGQQRVPKAYLGNYYFPLPPKEEQDKIVELLDSLYSSEMSITELTNLIEKVEFIGQSILTKAFRGELGTNDLTDGHAMEILKEAFELKGAK